MKLKEDAPINAAGAGNIASIGVGPKGEPPASKSKILRRGKFAGNDTFVVQPNTFHKARISKRDRSWWKKYIEEEDGIDEIRHFANRNPDKPVILQDASTGAMVYARYGKK